MTNSMTDEELNKELEALDFSDMADIPGKLQAMLAEYAELQHKLSRMPKPLTRNERRVLKRKGKLPKTDEAPISKSPMPYLWDGDIRITKQ